MRFYIAITIIVPKKNDIFCKASARRGFQWPLALDLLWSLGPAGFLEVN